MNFLILLCACFVHSSEAFQQCSSYHRSKLQSKEEYASDAVGEPLLLTPFIDAGNVDEARKRSRVAPLLDDIESYAGFLTVNRTTKSHLYFWFFPKTARNTTSSSPLVLWVQGGPGISSLFGLFTENGPFQLGKNGDLQKRVHAWTNNYHMLYIDQPVGTGFSFTENDGYLQSQEAVGEHLYEALVQFYQIFSEFRERELYIAGEGYAGKFIPTIAYKIHTANQAPPPALHIPLKGMVMGNAYSDAEYMQDFAEHYHGLGLIDRAQRLKLESKQEKIKCLIRGEKWLQAVHEVHMLYVDIGDAIDTVSMTDFTRDSFFLNYSLYENYVVQDRVRERIHVGPAQYDLISEEVHLRFLADMMKTARPQIEELLEHYPTLFYNGQFDILVPHRFTENFLSSLHWRGADEYGQAERRVWRVGDKVAGFIKSAANLTHVLVRNAGSYVPTDQPENALTLMDMFVENRLMG